MQNPQMATMAGMNPNAGPVDGTPLMNTMARQQRSQLGGDPRENLNTYIYDYFMRNNHHRLARMMVECDIKMNVNPPQKPSPSGRNVNGVDAMDQDSKDDLPQPRLPPNQIADNSFLLDWWVQFWDIFQAARGQQTKGSQYIAHTRNLAQMSTEQRNQRMMMNGAMNAAQYQNMMRAMPNGVGTNDLKRAAAMNNRNPNANPMANMNQMKNQAMMASAQMSRDGSGMDMNGQRPQSPASGDNAPSPNKRARVEGGMNAGNMPGNQFNEFAQQAQNAQQKNIEGMNAVQGSPMNPQGLDGSSDLFAGNQPRAPGMPQGAPGQPQGNHALQDYQMQLMLLEQQNKKRLLMARQEQDNISGPHAQGAVGGPGGFPASMSPQGSRPGPSPNPADQMKRGTPKMPQQGLPGSPMPDAAMAQQRSSPAPNMNFDPNQMPPGMPPQYYPQMPQTPMMRPPSSHPGNFNGQQLTPQQMEAMRQNGGMQNGGAWRGGPPQPGMMPNQQQQMGPMGNNPQQRGQMPPPPAPANEQPRTQEPSPSQPAQAPPTPSQGNKPNPKKKNTKDNKKPAKAKGANTGATPAASGAEEAPTPTPNTPITPMHKQSFGQGQNGQQQPAQAPVQPQPPTAPQQQQPPPMEPPFGNIDNDPNGFDIGLSFGEGEGLDNFDFDSFLHVGDESGGFGNLGTDFGFGDTAEVGGDL